MCRNVPMFYRDLWPACAHPKNCSAKFTKKNSDCPTLPKNPTLQHKKKPIPRHFYFFRKHQHTMAASATATAAAHATLSAGGPRLTRSSHHWQRGVCLVCFNLAGGGRFVKISNPSRNKAKSSPTPPHNNPKGICSRPYPSPAWSRALNPLATSLATR